MTAGDDWVLKAERLGCVYADNGSGNQPSSGVYADKFTLPRGQVTAIIGESGSGKSTLLSILAGLRKPNRLNDQSRLLYRGKDGRVWDQLRENRPPPGEIAFVFQEAQLIKAIPARANAKMAGHISNKGNAGELARDLAQDFELGPQWDKLSETLSGGQAQRIAIIRALCVEPNLIVCDEPTSSLDKTMSQNVIEALRWWTHETGCAVLWVTHELDLAAHYADRVALVSSGRVYCDAETGQPWTLDAPYEERLDILHDLIEQGRKQPALTVEALDRMIDRPGDAAPDEMELARAPRWRPGSLRSYGFVVNCAVDEVSLGMRRAVAAGSNRIWAHLRGLYQAMTRSLTLILFLGLTVFYFVALGRNVTEAALNAQLSQPSMSHFTMRTVYNGGQTLDIASLGVLDKTLFDAAPIAAEASDKARRVFGRRVHEQQYLWFPDESKDGTCNTRPLDGIEPYIRTMQVFDAREPLFEDLSFPAWNGVEADPEWRTRPGILATQGFMETFRIEAGQEICLELFNRTIGLPVLGVAEEFPGGGERKYPLAVTELVYHDLFLEAPPDNFVQNGKITLPTYREAAVYFDKTSFENVVCKFPDMPECTPDETPVLFGFKLDQDILNQVRGMLRAMDGASVSFAVLSWTFAATIVISTALATAAFVQRNEKSIAVMKAFGYTVAHMAMMIQTQIAVLLCLAIFWFLGLHWIFQTYAAPYAANAFDLPVEWLAMKQGLFWRAFIAVFLLSLLVTVVVIGTWWRKNRYLSETLQTI
ncbi:ABC transporter ATP-binding protein/permease [Mameliella alba]|uniref:AttE component of AttEFGH ABC transport system n=1 Tax=Mameliella alba TaxID=561184 RepID=A0A0B3SVV6_9RHOB|nr:ABC transporter ATP-binding protein [Mameliella alba]KHQ54574.1 AttE component of AttEFGH ABC transport system [Mameliella alba]